MTFNKQMPNWENEGAEPSSSLKQSGFSGGNKLPANIVNFFISLFSKAIAEIQTKLSNVDNTSDLAKPVSIATQTALAGKAAAAHNHLQSEISGLTGALDSKAYVVHTHTTSDITGFDEAIKNVFYLWDFEFTVQPNQTRRFSTGLSGLSKDNCKIIDYPNKAEGKVYYWSYDDVHGYWEKTFDYEVHLGTDGVIEVHNTYAAAKTYRFKSIIYKGETLIPEEIL